MTDRQPVLLPSLVRTLFLVAIAAASLVAIDSVLANTEKRETALLAARFYHDGQQLMQQHKYALAADAFRSAIANARGNTEYPLALGQALLDAGELDEANTTLTDLLQSHPMAGAPNLAMARVFAREGQFEDAEFYYHRAVYGQWKADSPDNQVKTRFELAELLAAQNSKAQLLAELLPLQEQAPADPATQATLGRMFMIAGSPARAAAIFRDLAQANPQDAAARESLGNAEFARGNYPEAQAAFIAAIRLRPDDQTARKALELCDQVLNLDPARRGLDAAERNRRTQEILNRVLEKVDQCPAVTPEKAPLDMELADKLWQEVKMKCPTAISAADEPLQLVLAKAAQRSGN